MTDVFQLCFSQSTSLDKKTLRCYNVTNRLFSNVQIENTNSTSSAYFSDAFLKYTIESEESINLSWFWCDGIEEIVENYCGEKTSNESRYQVVKLLRQCVQKFILDECNSKHLGKVKEAKSEAEIQAILAHHLFSKLAPTGKYVIDGRCTPIDLQKCPACKEDLDYGDTSIASDNKVRIIMYNCEQDRLYISEDMYLFDTLCDHGLNVGTIVSIWLALNFEIFQNEINEDDLAAIALKKSSFQEKLPDTVLSVYKRQMYRNLPTKRKQTEQPPVLLWVSEFSNLIMPEVS
ncbi:unnamed protein product [Mytilus edulis]|uniref:Uncharacterized protein n=1 Tax=Mytilus edulis TaxID=6550 RepID=A0A8S3SND8_MYTED|nr:unnamed protein product [Mytilus edulis]